MSMLNAVFAVVSASLVLKSHQYHTDHYFCGRDDHYLALIVDPAGGSRG
ncbi:MULTISPECIES: hypothetical protein [unclassified Agarivorans]